MMKYTIVCLSILIVSCNLSRKEEVDNVHSTTDFSKVEKDTLITYDIEGISAEGAEAKVTYVNGKITNSVTSIYGETGQAEVIYEFRSDKIKVLETKYSYKSRIENVKSDEDIQLVYEISYYIDFKGKLIGKDVPDRIAIFEEFKEVVPFEI